MQTTGMDKWNDKPSAGVNMKCFQMELDIFHPAGPDSAGQSA